MSLVCALICDLLIDLVIHLLMMDLEFPSTITSMKPISIPVSMTSKHAIASTSKAVPTAVGKRDLKIMTSLLAFRAIIADADLRPIQSNEALKLILMVGASGKDIPKGSNTYLASGALVAMGQSPNI
ncbi:hypothetical protein Gotri_020552 [Gossypium trilobum]|uniref:Uncharacterized protein n=1 Tax=Gossypium trilobum TaxID=34281 RepID=A0A7J9D9R8_9ROSI|nr:hypothetical protein [Gossypium trilobum]